MTAMSSVHLPDVIELTMAQSRRLSMEACELRRQVGRMLAELPELQRRSVGHRMGLDERSVELLVEMAQEVKRSVIQRRSA